MQLQAMALSKNIFNTFREFFLESNMIYTCGYQLSFFLFGVTTQQTFVLMKTSFVFVFRRRLDQDEYICLSHTSSKDVLVKTSIFVLAIRLRDVFKTFSRRLQDIFKRSCQDVLKTSSRPLAKISSRCF